MLAAELERSRLLVDVSDPPPDTEARVQRVRALARRLGDDYARIFNELHWVRYLQMREQPERALAVARDVLEYAYETLGPEHTAVAYTHDYVAGALAELGRFDEALEHKRRAIERLQLAYGDDALGVAVLLKTAGNVAALAGEHDLAAQRRRRAIGIIEARLGPGSPRLVVHLQYAADGARLRGDASEALSLYRRGLAIGASQRGFGHALRRGIVEAHLLAGDAAAARRAYARAMAALDAESARPAEGWNRSATLRAGAEVALARGEPALAIERARAAIDAAPSEPRTHVLPLAVIARAELSRGHLADAEVALLEAERGVGRRPGTMPISIAHVRYARWLLARARDDDEIARQRALAIASARRAFGTGHPIRAAVESGPVP